MEKVGVEATLKGLSQFQSGIQQMQKEILATAKSVQDVAKSTAEMNKSLMGAQKEIDAFGKSAGGAGQQISSFGIAVAAGIGAAVGGLAVSALQSAGQALVDFGMNAVNSAAELQNMTLALESLAAKELVNTGAAANLNEAFKQTGPIAQDLLASIRDISVVSPFEYKDVVQTFRLNMAFGATSDTALKLTTGILDMAAAMGLSGAHLERIAYNFGQMNVTGKITMRDVRDLALAGLDLTKVLQDQLGMSIDDVNSALASGKLTMQDVSEAFVGYSAKNFGGAAERMSKTFSGLKSSFADLMFFAGADLMTPALEKVTELLGGVFDSVNKLVASGKLKAVGEQIGEWVGKVAKPLTDVANSFFFLLNTLSGDEIAKGGKTFAAFTIPKETIVQITEFIDKIKGPAKQAFDDLSKAAVIVWDNLSKFASFEFTEFKKSVSEIAEQVKKFLGSEDFKKTVDQIVTNLQKSLDSLSKFWDQNGESITKALQTIGSAFTTAFGAGLVLLLTTAAGAITLATGALSSLLAILNGDWEGATKSAGDSLTSFFNLASGLAGGDLATFTATWQYNFDTMNQILVTWSGQAGANIRLFFDESYANLIIWSGQVGANLRAWLDGLFLSISTWFVNVWTTFTTKLAEINTGIVTWSGEVGAQWRTTFDNFLMVVNEKFTEIVTSISNKISEIITTITGFVGQFTQAGADLINGMRDGVKSALGDLIDSVVSGIKDTIAAAKNALQEHSPSKVFHEIGEFTMIGFSNGVEAATGDAVRQMGFSIGMATNAAAGQIASSFGSVFIPLDPGGDGMPAIAQRVEQTLPQAPVTSAPSVPQPRVPAPQPAPKSVPKSAPAPNRPVPTIQFNNTTVSNGMDLAQFSGMVQKVVADAIG